MDATQKCFLVNKENLCAGLNKALLAWNVVAPVKGNKDKNQLSYEYITDSSAVSWEYQPTIISPKTFFFPQQETLLEYKSSGEVVAKIEAKPLVLFGIRPCDANGLKLLTEAFQDDHGDPNYLAKREGAIIIGVDCKKICDQHAFCYKVNAANARPDSYDVMLHEETDGNFIVLLATEKGANFVHKYFSLSPAKEEALNNFFAEKQVAFGDEKQFTKLYDFPIIFEQNKNHPVWVEEGNRCLSCGSCIMVCPTCYCFDVQDEWDLDLRTGRRMRHWGACMLNCFAVVAGGENFRGSATARLQHRINRKFNYLFRKHGESACVGCGRCVRACLADISPKKIASAIVGDKE